MEFKPLDWTGWRISENGPSSGDSRRVARTTYVKEGLEIRRMTEKGGRERWEAVSKVPGYAIMAKGGCAESVAAEMLARFLDTIKSLLHREERRKAWLGALGLLEFSGETAWERKGEYRAFSGMRLKPEEGGWVLGFTNLRQEKRAKTVQELAVREKEELISRRLEEEKTLNDCRRHTGFILELLGWAGLSSVPLETVSRLTGASVRRLSSHSEGGELLYKAGIETVLVRRLGETREGLMERIQADFDRQASVLKNELEFLLEGWDDNQI